MRRIAATVQFTEGVAVGLEAYEINGAQPTTRNSFEQPDAVSVQRRPLEVQGQAFDYTFPAHSITLLRFQMAEQASSDGSDGRYTARSCFERTISTHALRCHFLNGGPGGSIIMRFGIAPLETCWRDLGEEPASRSRCLARSCPPGRSHLLLAGQ